MSTHQYGWFQIDVCDHGWKRTCDSGLKHVCHVESPKWEDTHALPLDPFHHPMGPLSLCEGQSYLLTTVYRWCKALPMPDISMYSTAKTFVASWVSRFGVPAVITTDRGKQFESDIFNQLMKLLENKRIKKTAYHPKPNGLVERFYRSLKSTLRGRMNQLNWLEHLPLVLLELLTAVKDDKMFICWDGVWHRTQTPWTVFFCDLHQNLWTWSRLWIGLRQGWWIRHTLLRKDKGPHTCQNFCRPAPTFLCGIYPSPKHCSLHIEDPLRSWRVTQNFWGGNKNKITA